jgi:large subunit ribosomal protein L11
MRKKDKSNLVEFSMFLRAGNVDSGPPLSTILGNYGVNTSAFCKDFNEQTKVLPNYFLIETFIVVNSDRTYSFFIKEPSVAFLLKLVSGKSEIYVKGQGGLRKQYLKTVRIKDVYLVSLFKFGSLNSLSLKTVCAILTSSHYYLSL